MRSNTMNIRPYYARYQSNRHVYRRSSTYYRHARNMRKLHVILIILSKLAIPITLISLSIATCIGLSNIFTEDDKPRQLAVLIPQELPRYETISIEDDSAKETEIPLEITETLERYSERPDVLEPASINVPEPTLEDMLGDDEIQIDGVILRRYDTPDVYYPELDFSSFQPWMDYRKITNTRSQAYKICNDDLCYTDSNGLRRFKVLENEFSIDGVDDYVVALGTFYKPKGQAGLRFLIVTSTGMYTIITGDEKADIHTDSMNMFTMHADGTRAGIIEWIVDTNHLNAKIKSSGTVTKGPVEELQGEILYIYGIEE